jgi:O-glycosyl hydrolase
MMKIFALAVLFTGSACLAAEQATYDSAGGLTSLISNGVELPVHGGFVATFTGAPGSTIQPDDQRSPIVRKGTALHWEGNVAFPNGSQAQMSATWAESDAGVAIDGSVTAKPLFPGMEKIKFPLDVASVDYVLDLPRSNFAGWHLEPSGQPFPQTRPADPTFFSETTPGVTFADPEGNWKLSVAFDQPRLVTVTDTWDASGRSYRVRITLQSGAWMTGDTLKLGMTLKLTGTAHAAPASLSVDPTSRLYSFDGFGGNYRMYTDTPIADYTLNNLTVSWTRFEFKAINWDHERNAATLSPQLTRDFELMQKVQKKGIPMILSLWFLPERYYTDPNQKGFGAFGRQIAPERWPEFLDLLGSYLVYLKAHYGVEPDLFSFNESDLGVNIGFTPETHRDEIRRIGAHLASLGLKTRMLLGDTANPRDSHKFVLAAAADAEAMRYVGAVSVHSWGSGTPAQYEAWADVGAWLRLPLLVAEAGVDPGAYKNSAYDSYAYGLREAGQFQDLLRHVRPQAIIYWQFTDDYGLVHVGPGGAIEPTGRFWLMKQFTNLSPVKGDVIQSASDQADVKVSAFAKGDLLVAHVLNLGADRDATISGLPHGSWGTVTTTELSGYQESTIEFAEGSPALRLHLPARSLTTLVRK